MNQAPTKTNQIPTRIYHNKTGGVNGKGQYKYYKYKDDAPPLFLVLCLKPYCLCFINCLFFY